MMKASKIALLLMLGAATGFSGCKRAPTGSQEATAEAVSVSNVKPTAGPVGAAPDSVIVYYFHGNRRCRTCVGIQEAITRTVDERFSAETASGALAFRAVNIDAPENAHFVKEFNLSFSSMVVTAKSGEKTTKWLNCDQVWPLAHDQAALETYTEKQIRSYLDSLQRT